MFVHSFGERLTTWIAARGIRFLPRPKFGGEAEIKVSHREDRFVTMNMLLDKTGTLLAELEVPGRRSGSVHSWSPGDFYLDGQVHEGPAIWNGQSGRVLAVIDALEPATYRFWSPDGRYLLFLSDQGMVRWSEATGPVALKVSIEDGKPRVGAEKLNSSH